MLLGFFVWQSSSDHFFHDRLNKHSNQLQETDEALQTQQTSIDENRTAVAKEGQVNTEQQVTLEALQRDLTRLEKQVAAHGQQQIAVEGRLKELPELRDRLDHLRQQREGDRAGIQELREQLDQLLDERATTAKRLDAIEAKLGLVPDL